MRAPRNRLRLGAHALAASLLGLCVAGCNVVGARVHNLGELHTDDGYHRHTAVLLSSWEWAVRSGFSNLAADQEVSLGETTPSKVDDPNSTCLDNLVELGLHTGEGGYERSVRIATYARLAVNCPWKLSRERCVILLGREGRELDLEGHPVPAPGPQTVDVDQLVGALGELLKTARPALEGRAAEVDAELLRSNCERLATFDYDLDGARRAMSMVALIARRVGKRNGDFECVRELSIQLQRVCVDRALRAALIDARPFERSGSDPGWDSPRVRAAAVEACLVAVGPQALAEFLARLDPREHTDVLLAVLRGVARYGLPTTLRGRTSEEVALWQERATEALVGIAIDHPEGRVRTAAMYALGRVSGNSFESLREEDWYNWFLARRAMREAEREAAREAGAP